MTERLCIAVEVRPTDRDLTIPLSVDAPPAVVSKVLPEVLAQAGRDLIEKWQRDYDGRIDGVRFQVTISVATSQIDRKPNGL